MDLEEFGRGGVASKIGKVFRLQPDTRITETMSGLQSLVSLYIAQFFSPYGPHPTSKPNPSNSSISMSGCDTERHIEGWRVHRIADVGWRERSFTLAAATLGEGRNISVLHLAKFTGLLLQFH